MRGASAPEWWATASSTGGSGRWLGVWALELGGDPTLERTGRSGPRLLELARRLRSRGVRMLNGPLALTSRTGPAASRYPAAWSTSFEGQLYAPPVGPIALHENTVSLTFRPGSDIGTPPTLMSAYPIGAERWYAFGHHRRRKREAAEAPPNVDGGWTLDGTVGM